MRENGLIARCAKRRKNNSYEGEITPIVLNLLQRNFHATAPNIKWLTDITEFSIAAGKVYRNRQIQGRIDRHERIVVERTGKSREVPLLLQYRGRET